MSEMASQGQQLSLLLIRRATSADSPAVQRFVFDTLRSYGIEPDPTGLDADVVAFGAGADGALEWVADLAGTAVGSIVITPMSADEGKLSKFFVDVSRRGYGIGRKLLAHAVAEAQARGYRRLHLETRTIYREAVHLYEATGWVRGPDLPPGYGPDRTYTLELPQQDDRS
ncbi:MAG TPA: GNAT family N-acetyltransferase [Ktedonobacterales bacterium]|nr:GNAT family N-acetyltransferase [Ktedonobacterales bacterium]